MLSFKRKYMLVGLVGKPSAGKSTLLNAICLSDAKVGDYPFTTIEPNKGVGYVVIDCVCKKLGVTCDPRHGACVDGHRFVPVKLLDVAGLVPGAHEGRGMGNKFLDDLRQADVLIHVVDLSGSLDAEGNLVEKGSWDPKNDILFLEEEIDYWLLGILKNDWDRLSRRIEAEKLSLAEIISDRLSGLKATKDKVRIALKNSKLDDSRPTSWIDKDLFVFASNLRKILFPIIIAGNKIDREGSEENYARLKSEGIDIIPCSGLAEFYLRKLSEKGIIDYIPGSSSFKIIDDSSLSSRDRKTLEQIKAKLLDKYGSTGVQQVLKHALFDVLGLIPVYPVEDASHYSDKDGRVLPDIFLVPKGTTPKELAAMVHTDLAKKFIHAIILPSGRRVGDDYELQPYDVVKIVHAA